VLVLREVTERTEGIDAGTARLVGTDEERIVSAVSELLTDESAYRQMATASKPYGDGQATKQIIAAVRGVWSIKP
jgi:UDP-N-acetylglucosamine 2-epimerase (non-hydrolysing)